MTVAYYCTLTRDTVSAFITFYFMLSQQRKEHQKSLALMCRTDHDTYSLFDFKYVFESVLPHAHFKKFLEKTTPEFLPYLDIC